MDTPGVQTVKRIVTDIVFFCQLGKDKWNFVYKLVIDAIREIHMFHTDEYKVVKVNVDSALNTIDWPDDYLGFVFLGIPLNGTIWTLTKDNDLITTTTLVNGQETLDSEAGEGVTISKRTRPGYAVKGGVNKFYYKEDPANRRIFINGINPANVLLGYVSSGVTDAGTLVPMKYKSLIENYVRSKLFLLGDKPDTNSSEYFLRLYYDEVSKLKIFESPTLDEIYDGLSEIFTGVMTK